MDNLEREFYEILKIKDVIQRNSANNEQLLHHLIDRFYDIIQRQNVSIQEIEIGLANLKSELNKHE